MIKTDHKIISLMRRAINDHKMIENGDRIAVGLSGGKDSLALLAALAAYRRFCPQQFTLKAITIDLGFKDSDFSEIVAFCNELDVEYHIEKTNIAEIIFDIRKESSPCSLCSKMRRGALNTVLIKLGLNKLALGHHSDDLIETFLLSLFYEGRLSTFAPISFMDRTGVTLIRPFVYVSEKSISSLSRNYPIAHNPCPVNHHTQREYMKNLVASLQNDIPISRDNIFRALTNPSRSKLWNFGKL